MGLDSAFSIASGGLATSTRSSRCCRRTSPTPPRLAMRLKSARSSPLRPMALAWGCIRGRRRCRSIRLCRHRSCSRMPPWRTADDADVIAGDRQRAGHARIGERHLAACWATCKQLFHPADQPEQPAQQSAVVASATTLAQGINTLSAAYSAQRQAAQNDLSSAVDTLNSTLATIGQLSSQIIAMKPTSQSIADLENQRNAAVQTLSQLLNVRTVAQPNGDLSVFTTTGMDLPTHDGPAPFSLSDASTPTGSFYPGGGIPGITLNGNDVTNQLAGGQMGLTSLCVMSRYRPTRRSWMSSHKVFQPVRCPRSDAVYRSSRQRAGHRRNAGTGELCGLRQHNTGECRGHRAIRPWFATVPPPSQAARRCRGILA